MRDLSCFWKKGISDWLLTIERVRKIAKNWEKDEKDAR